MFRHLLSVFCRGAHFEHGRSKREIAGIINASPSTVSEYVARAKLAGLTSPLPADCNDAALEQLLSPPSEPSSVRRPAQAWLTVHDELRRKGVTLELLWQEHKAEQPGGYQRLQAGLWLWEKQNELLTGPTGVGKTWLAGALAHQACRMGRSAYYVRLPRLLD